MPAAKNEWDVTPKEAVEVQRALAQKVRLTPLSKDVKTIAGVDVSLNLYSSTIYAGVVALSYPELEPIDYSVLKTETKFTYIPGLLSFREVPALMKCFDKLKTKPDIIMVDGQGIAHPRHIGIASHLGVLLDIPTIGVAKSKLYGVYKEPMKIDVASKIKDPKTGALLGYALKSKMRANPLLVSPGHLITADEALDWARRTIKGYRLPEPTRRAHALVNAFRRGEELKEYNRMSV